MKIVKSFGSYLKTQRVSKSLTRGQVAERLNTSPKFYEEMEMNSRRPSYAQFQKLVKLLDLDLVVCKSLVIEMMKEENNENSCNGSKGLLPSAESRN